MTRASAGTGVRPFDALTPAGQVRRLRQVALAAAPAYGLPAGGARCSFVAASFNTVFRLAGRGRRCALRVGPALRIHADGTEAAEAAWTAALRSDVGLAVADVVPAADGSVVVHRTATGVPGDRPCTAFRWVAGRPLAAATTVERARRLGRLAALLHEHASSWPAGGDGGGVLVADRVLYWRLPDRLGELRAAYGSLLDDGLARAEEVVASLWRDPPHAPHLLHGDLTPANVLVERGGLVPVDFQDLVVGFDVQDLSISLGPLDRADPTGGLAAAFRAGYAGVRPWPDLGGELLAALVVARRLHQLNLGLALGGPGLDAYAAGVVDLVRRWTAGRR